jgi:hypothetical protein
MRRHPTPAEHPDHGGIVLGWLTRVSAVLVLCGLALFDAMSIGMTSVGIVDDGAYAARAGSELWQETHDIQRAYDASVAAAQELHQDNRIAPETYRADPDGTVHLHIARTARTLVVYRFDRTRPWAQLDREVAARSVG